MPTPWLGTSRALSARIVGRGAIAIGFETARSDRLHQLYVGRRLIGATTHVTDREVRGNIPLISRRAPLTVVSVDPLDRLTDFGALLPSWPTDEYTLEWSGAGLASDTARFRITGSTAPGQPVDHDHVLGSVRFYGAGAYLFELPLIVECGTWEFGVTPIDNATPDGNVGTPATVTVSVLVPPDDVVADTDGNRFTATTEAGLLEVAFTYPS